MATAAIITAITGLVGTLGTMFFRRRKAAKCAREAARNSPAIAETPPKDHNSTP